MRIFGTLLQAWSYTIVAGLLVVLPVTKLGHVQLLDVQTTSMVLSFAPHDLLVTRPIVGTQLAVGSIVTYRSNANPRELISHRVISVNQTHHSLRTQGDALAYPDPPIAQGSVTGQVVAVLPAGDYATELAREPLGLVLLLYVPVCLLLLAEYRRLVQHYRQLQMYRVYGRQVV